MSSFFGRRAPVSGLSGQQSEHSNPPSYAGTDLQASSAGTAAWSREAAEEQGNRKWGGNLEGNASGHLGWGQQQQQPAYTGQQYPEQAPQIDVPPSSIQYDGNSAFTGYAGTEGDASLLAPTGNRSLGRSDTIASKNTQHSAATSLSGLSQPGMPTAGAVWKLGRHDPVLPDYRGIPVVPGTTTYRPGKANGGTWHELWKLQVKDKDQAFVDTWDTLTEQCECGYGQHLPVQKNLCPKLFQKHNTNARGVIRILKEQFFIESEKVTVHAVDRVLDSGDTFGKLVRGEYDLDMIHSRISLPSSLWRGA
jgi:hypothetical protein